MEYLTVGFNPLAQPLSDSDNLLDLGELPENSFRGVASVFGGLVDAWVPTIIHRGAFTKTLQESGRGVKILWQHNTDEPIGLPSRLFEGEEGLIVQADISRTTRGRDALILLRDEVIDAMSIGFDTIKETTEQQADGSVIRHIHEVRLWEISLVTFGADPDARIHEVNNHPAAGILSKQASLNLGRLEVQVVQCFADLPLSDRGREWEADEAQNRVSTWAKDNVASYQKWACSFVYREEHGTEFGHYKLLIADVVDGKLTVIPNAVFAAAAAVQKSTDIPEDTLPAIRRHLASYFRKMHKEFDDPSIVPPWEMTEFAMNSFCHFTREDAGYLIGVALGTESLSIESAHEALGLVMEAESVRPLTPLPADVLNLQLMQAELAMAEAYTAIDSQ